MTTPNSPNQPEENPFEFSVGSDPDVSYRESSGVAKTEDAQLQMPPVESSYWVGAAGLGLIAFSGCWISWFPLQPYSGIFFLGIVVLGWSLCCAIPFALIRLALHRWNIRRAIETETYPGGQRFGIGYLIYSILLSLFCLMGGGLDFFGICTGVFLTGELWMSPYGPFGTYDWIPAVLFGVDAVVSLFVAGFLLKLGIPKYR
jgi:hypothetical protein